MRAILDVLATSLQHPKGRERGSTAIECSLIAGLIAVAIIGSMPAATFATGQSAALAMAETSILHDAPLAEAPSEVGSASATDRTDVVMLGHSFFDSSGGDTESQFVVAQVGDKLRAKYPADGAGSSGYVPAYTGRLGAALRQFTTVSGTAPTLNEGWGWGDKVAQVVAGSVISIRFNGDRLNLAYGKNVGTGMATLTLDGSSAGSIAYAAAAASDGYLWDSGVLSPGDHVLRIAVSGNSFHLAGWHVFKGNYDNGIHVIRAGHSSFTTQDYQANLRTTFPSLVAASQPEFVVLMCLTNDYYYGIAPATTKRNLIDIIDAFKANTRTVPGFMITAEWQRADAGFTPTNAWSDYVLAAKGAAVETGAAFVDMGAVVVNTPASVNTTYVKADKVHPNDAGAALIADAIVDGIDPAVVPGIIQSVAPAASGSGDAILAAVFHRPATKTVYTTRSNYAFVDVAAGLTITFTAPATGNVIVQLQAEANAGGVTNAQRWNLRNAGGDVEGTSVVALSSSTGYNTITRDILLTGLVPGASYTYKWGYVTTTNAVGVSLVCGGTQDGPAVMKAIDAGVNVTGSH